MKLLTRLKSKFNFMAICSSLLKFISIFFLFATVFVIVNFYISFDVITSKHISLGQKVIYDVEKKDFLLDSDPKVVARIMAGDIPRLQLPKKSFPDIAPKTTKPSVTTEPNSEPKHESNPITISEQKPVVKKPRIAFLVANLALSESNTKLADHLPAWIAVGISPYGSNISKWDASFLNKGHEIYTELPMESLDDQKFDYGNLSLLCYATDEQNLNNYNTIVGKFKKLQGFYFIGQEQFTKNDKAKTIFNEIKKSNFKFIYAPEGSKSIATNTFLKKMNISYITNPIILDNDLSNFAIQSKFKELMESAVKNGVAFAITRPYPIAINSMLNWIEENKDNSNIEFVKLSEIIE